MHDHGRRRILDDGRTGEAHAGPELCAVVNRRFERPFLREIDLPGRLPRPVRACWAEFLPVDLHAAHRCGGGDVDTDQLHGSIQAIGVFTFVFRFERASDRLNAGCRHHAFAERDLGRVFLVLVTELAKPPERQASRVDAFTLELHPCRVLGLDQDIVDRLRVFWNQVDQVGRDVVAAQVGHHHSPGREHGRGRRYHHLGDAEFGGERDRVHTATAAERNERELARVEPPVQRHQLERVDHVVVGDPNDAGCRLLRAESEPATDIAQHRFHGSHVRVQFAAAEVVAVHPSQPEIRVGGGRVPAAHTVGCRTGHSACRTRSDVQLAEFVDPGYRTAAVADLDHVDDRHHDRVARRPAVAPDPVVGHDLDVALIDERALCRGAADVEGDNIPVADQRAELGSAPDAGGWSGFDHRDRRPCRGLDRIDAAVGLHDIVTACETLAREAVAQATEVAFGSWLHKGGKYGRAGALVLTPLARDAVRRHRVDFGPETPDLRFGGAFVRRVRVGVQEADRDRLDAVATEILDHRCQWRKVQWPHFRAAVVHPARQFAAQVARNEGLRFLVVQIEQVRPVAAGDFQRVPKALGGDQSDLRTLALGKCVDDDGRAMHKRIDLAKRHATLAQHVEDAAFEVRRSGRRLCRGHPRLPGLGIDVQSDEIRERAAYIHSNPQSCL